MAKNMGQIDRVIRIILAIVVGVLIYMGTLTGVWAWVLGIIAVILLLTGLVSFCPLNVPFKISTLKKAKKGESA